MAKKKKMYTIAEVYNLITEDQLKVASGMLADAAFMEEQLAQLRETIKTEGVSENYQYGSKQTAAMTSYLQIQKQYGVIVKYLTELVSSNTERNSNSDELMEFLAVRE